MVPCLSFLSLSLERLLDCERERSRRLLLLEVGERPRSLLELAGLPVRRGLEFLGLRLGEWLELLERRRRFFPGERERDLLGISVWAGNPKQRLTPITKCPPFLFSNAHAHVYSSKWSAPWK